MSRERRRASKKLLMRKTVGTKTLEYGCRVIHPGSPASLGFGLWSTIIFQLSDFYCMQKTRAFWKPWVPKVRLRRFANDSEEHGSLA